ncbi:MAG: ADP-ribosylglycohydrolase family protein [Acidobacteria bacterium]|nr:ADP-ribosylglycohydrolase family protein [Acidobacteriota bacterium]MBI3655052.1 ADP-ribosylglycohydrolase family protein [Acidobacteriota bacterium]
MTTLLARFQGAFMGLAIGDALGMPAKFLSREQIKEYYGGEIRTYRRAHRGHSSSHLDPGCYTDETQLNRIVAESLVQCGRLEPFHVAERLVEWFHSEDCRGPGPTVSAALKHLAAGVPWNKSGVHAAGCGAGIRALPIALLYHRDEEELRENTKLCSLITHNDSKAIAGAVAVAYLIARLLHTEELSVSGLIRGTAHSIEELDGELAAQLRWVLSLLPLPTEEALAEIGTSGYILETLPAAAYCFIKTPTDFSASVLSAVNAGEDADSVACLAGAFSGAYNGVGRIPPDWITQLEDRDWLMNLASSLCALSTNQIRPAM